MQGERDQHPKNSFTLLNSSLLLVIMQITSPTTEGRWNNH